MASGVEGAIVDFLARYGYLAYFIVLTLETGFIIHFVPGELIVSVAAAQLATSPLQLALVTLVGTAATTSGCLLLYFIVRYGGGRILERLAGRHKHHLDRLQRTFERPSGEAMVFVFRFLPVVRTLITFPAAIARMDVWRFTAYSAAGNFLFVLVIAYFTYVAKRNDVIREWIRGAGAYLHANLAAILVVAAALALLGYWIWSERKAIRDEPHHVVARAWQGAALLAVVTGLVTLGAAFVAPDRTRDMVSLVLSDYSEWARAHGLSDLVTVLIVAAELLMLGLLALTLTRAVRTLAGFLRRRRVERP